MNKNIIMNHIFSSKTLFFSLAIILLGPALFTNGYIFLLDMPWPENIQLSDYTKNGISAHFPIMVFLAALNVVLPGWLIQKLLLLAILTFIPLGMHRLWHRVAEYMPQISNPSFLAMLAALLYVCNPFVAERLLAGQWLVLAGMALAPFTLSAFITAIMNPSRARNWHKAGLLYIISPVVSLHWWFMITPIILGALWLRRKQLVRFSSLQPTYLFILIFVVLQSYWVVPLLANKNSIVRASDFEAFTTLADPSYGVWVNVGALYGFWNQQLFSIKESFALWPLSALLIGVLSVFGLRFIAQRGTVLSRFLLVLGFYAPIALVLAVGYGSNISKPIIDILGVIPGFVGMRETAKYVGVLALFYSIFVPFGVHALLRDTKLQRAPIIVAVMLLVVLSSNGMLWGARSQLASSTYPDGWNTTKQLLNKASDTNTLVLPWQGYLNVRFAQNKFIANPASIYFDTPITKSSYAGNRLLNRETTLLDAHISKYPLYDITRVENWLDVVKNDFGFSHIILLKTDSWDYYSRLRKATVIFEDDDILLLEL